MNQLRIPLAFLITCIFLLSVQSARAQRRRPVPRRPTISPWLNLSRTDPGPLGGYLSDVRPRQQLARSLQQQNARLQHQGSSIRSLGRRMSLAERPPESVRPTGTGGVFMNYSHYYQMRGLSGSSGSRRSWTPHTSRSQRAVGMGSSGHLGLGL